jgi:trimeric autotransporter adhesin
LLRTSFAFVLAMLIGTALTFWAPIGQAQQPLANPTSTTVPVPRLVQFRGMVKEAAGKPVAGITFALYKDQEGGAPIWMETQNVPLDESGLYSMLLGATKTEGLPMELFTSGEARWLGVQAEGQPEQPLIF